VPGFDQVARGEVAARVGRSASSIANRLRLLKISPAVRAEIDAGGLTERHARALLRLETEEEQAEAARRAIQMQLTVRALEQLIERMLAKNRSAGRRMRGVYRDHRLFVNTMMSTVRTLQSSGIGVTSRVKELPDGVEITVIIPKAAAKEPAACPQSRL